MEKEIRAFLEERFLTDVGFSKCEDTPFPGLTHAVSMVFSLSDAVVEGITEEPTHTYFHHYRTMNAYIDSVSLQLVLYLQGKGYRAAAVPASQSVDAYSGIFSHKKAAVRAGLGYIGKSALFISDARGPRVRLGTVFTDAPLPENVFPQKSRCGDCDACTRACGAMAIRGAEYKEGMGTEDILDARACSEYMKKKFQHIGRGAVCGVCMRVCPKGQKK